MLSLLEVSCRAGVTPSVISFDAAISACEKGGQWQQALSLLEDILTCMCLQTYLSQADFREISSELSNGKYIVYIVISK